MMADKREGTSYAEILKEKLAHTPAESTRIASGSGHKYGEVKFSLKVSPEVVPVFYYAIKF
jgi:hypothetical protein